MLWEPGAGQRPQQEDAERGCAEYQCQGDHQLQRWLRAGLWAARTGKTLCLCMACGVMCVCVSVCLTHVWVFGGWGGAPLKYAKLESWWNLVKSTQQCDVITVHIIYQVNTIMEIIVEHRTSPPASSVHVKSRDMLTSCGCYRTLQMFVPVLFSFFCRTCIFNLLFNFLLWITFFALIWNVSLTPRWMSQGPTATRSSCSSLMEERRKQRKSSKNTTPNKRWDWTQPEPGCLCFPLCVCSLTPTVSCSQVRIFTFSVGQHNYDKGPIQWMACHNKGSV